MKLWKILTVTALILVLILSVLPIHGERAVYDNVIRLHVIANSDSEADQHLKLAVRDAILSVCAPRLSQCHTREEAIAAVKELSPLITDVAKETLRTNGCEDPVTVALGEEKYPLRQYEDLCFPSGTYLSLQIRIGEAAGQNWWCVLFPPICMSAATETKKQTEDAFIAVGFTPEQYRIITETDHVTYRIKFKILEVFDEIFG